MNRGSELSQVSKALRERSRTKPVEDTKGGTCSPPGEAGGPTDDTDPAGAELGLHCRNLGTTVSYGNGSGPGFGPGWLVASALHRLYLRDSEIPATPSDPTTC